MQEELYTIEEVATLLRVTRKAVYDLMRAGRLPYVQIGIQRGRRIRRSALEEFLKGANKGGVQYNSDEIPAPGFGLLTPSPSGG